MTPPPIEFHDPHAAFFGGINRVTYDPNFQGGAYLVWMATRDGVGWTGGYKTAEEVQHRLNLPPYRHPWEK